MRAIPVFCLLACLGGCPQEQTAGPQDESVEPAAVAIPNDNRVRAGTLSDGVLRVDLVALAARWQPEGSAGQSLPVFAFSEAGRTASIPGPLIRVPEGTEVRISLENRVPENRAIGLPPANRRSSDAFVTGPELIVHGFPAGAPSDNVLRIRYGEKKRLRFVADQPGTYLYWADTTGRSIRERSGLDAQLSGAIIVDPLDKGADPNERVFVITMTDVYDDGSGALPAENGYFELGINGLSWPYTERLYQAVGETVRWRWINGSGFEHPMHLHGFHFDAVSRGDGSDETRYSPEQVQQVVTEFMEPGSTFSMTWTPTRAGNWLMHCHIRDHIIPDPPRSPGARNHDLHDVSEHALRAMAGLVMGIVVEDEREPVENTDPVHEFSLVVRQKLLDDSRIVRGYSLASGDGEPPAGLQVPGPPIVLSRGELSRIIISSELDEPTTVHWHGMELRSFYDGVAGWSGASGRLAPLITAEDPFTVYLRPPRSGTFIYHTHMDETEQLMSGLYGPLIVLEPGDALNPDTDHIFVIGDAIDGDYEGTTINGARHPPPTVITAGVDHRLRLINITAGSTVDIVLRHNGESQRWRPLAKDGAVLPDALTLETPALVRMGTGETYDFQVRFDSPQELVLAVDWIFATEPGHLVLEQPLQVR